MSAFNYENSFNGSAPSISKANVLAGPAPATQTEIEETHTSWRNRSSIYFKVEWHYQQYGILYLVGDIANIINQYGDRVKSLQVRGDLTNPQSIVDCLSWKVPGIKLVN